MRAAIQQAKAGLGRLRDQLDTQWLLTLALGALGAFIVTYLLTANLFVWTEARDMIGFPGWPGDVWRWLLFPELNYGPGRLTGMASFQLTGALCGTDLACVNGLGAAMVASATVLLLVHTRQITRSAPMAVAIAILWVLSPAVLSLSFWQSARFDILAVIGVLASGILWWDVFGRRRLSPAWAIAAVVASILLMAFTFNAKELGYLLVGMMPALAVVRGAGRWSALWRNLALSVVPVLYGTWFIIHALTHIQPAYAATISNAPMLDKSVQLLSQMLGVHPGFMFIRQQGPDFELLNRAALLGLGLFLAALTVAGVMSVRGGLMQRPLARLRSRHWGHLIKQAGPWLYLGGMFIVVLVTSSRSRGANAYYLPLAYWALLSLGGMGLRWVSGYLPRPRLAVAVLAILFAVPALSGYASLLTERSTYGRLVTASSQMADAGSILRNALEGRDVEGVSWRMLDLGPEAFYVTRGDARTFQPGRDIWPWLMKDATKRPQVTPLEEGALEQLRATVSEFAAPGEVLLVMDRDYELLMLAHEGEILWDPDSAQ